ncbi:hypothetical protein HMPREF9710_01788 [Massilia timonae CCUG 45783]|uniref:Tle cognate immunity protein 4 C-terminal domain-containing protein n=2 Tax=Telluria group TaxID=2895353 RepID=K9DVT4_9BURK|nr:hypothetical protein HMPREF9710_01788 [Massilia timonae CCUG 45783]
MNFEGELEVVKYCVGRTFIEVPRNLNASSSNLGIFREEGLGSQAPTIDVNVSTSEVSMSSYLAQIRRREVELREMEGANINILRQVRKISDTITIFRVQSIDDAYVSEAIALVEGALVSVRLDSFRHQFDHAEQRLIDIIHRLKHHNYSTVESMSGFCLGRLVLVGEFDVEIGSYAFFSKNGVHLSVNVDTYAPNEHVNLLSRVSGPKSLLSIFKVDHTVLRAREFSMAGVKAQEWLSWAILQDDSDVRTHTFELQTIRPIPSKEKPLISVTLRTAQAQEDGMYPATSTPDEEVIRIWDSIVESIQPVEA